MAYQNAPRPAQPPAQYRPPQQLYQPPRSQAPRQPQSYTPTAPERRTGLSCLSKLAILVIVLAIAVAIGVTVGKQLSRHNANTNNGANIPLGQIHRPRSAAVAGVGLGSRLGYDN
jgi:hypothetical protein